MSIKGSVHVIQNNEKIIFLPTTTYGSVIKTEDSNITLEQELESLKQCIIKLSEILGNKISNNLSDINDLVENIDTFYNNLKEDNLNVVYGSNKQKPVVIR